MNFDNNDSLDLGNSMTNVSLVTMLLSDNDNNSYNNKNHVSNKNFNTDLETEKNNIFYNYFETIFKIINISVLIYLCAYVVRTFFNTNNPIEFALKIFSALGYTFVYMLIVFAGLFVLTIIATILFEIFKDN